MDDLLADFIAETSASLDQIETDLARLGASGVDRAALDRTFRALHTIKGACGFLNLPRIEALMHASEAALERVRDGRAPPDIMTVLRHTAMHVKAILAELAEKGAEPAGDDEALLHSLSAGPGAIDWATELTRARDRLVSLAGDAMAPFQKLTAVAASMERPPRVPADTALRSLPLIVQDLAASLDKPIKLDIDGGDVEIDRLAVAPLKDALGHLIRNCADHGLEPQDERKKLGKPKIGLIRLSVVQEGETIIVRLQDDGRGLDTARIRNRAISQGLVFASDAVRMSADQIHRYIFAPGFSTAERATRHSGRGIGLDAVRASMEALGGSVGLESERGVGTLFTLTIPVRPLDIAPAPAEEASAALPVEDARVA